MQIYSPLTSETDPQLQKIEIATFFQLPHFQIIGLPSPEVSEAKERIRSAIEASGIEFPKRRIILNLSPASIRKRGTGIDLAMALAILAFGANLNKKIGAWGELGLDGSIKPAGQITRSIYAAWQGELDYLLLSEADFERGQKVLQWLSLEKEWSGKVPHLIPVKSLFEAWTVFTEGPKHVLIEGIAQGIRDPHCESKGRSSETTSTASCLFPISPALERTIGMIASGQHHSLFLGPRGVGKSQLIEWLIALKPPSSSQMRLKRLLIAELAGLENEWEKDAFQEKFSIRRIGHHVRPAALIGSTRFSVIQPGEYSLSHGGILVADEFPEWARDSRESLREPLERGVITLARTPKSIELPAQFQLAATGNLCPCGGLPTEISLISSDETMKKKMPRCRCTYTVKNSYLSRLSGPLLDRVDVLLLMTGATHLVKRETREQMDEDSNTEEQLIRLRKKAAQTQQLLLQSYGQPSALLSGVKVEELLKGNRAWKSNQLLKEVSSLRSRHKIARIALTLAAWDGVPQPNREHFMEASLYRADLNLLKAE